MNLPEKRREPRYPIQAEVTVRKAGSGEPISTVSVNLSGAGMYLQVPHAAGVSIGDPVTCEVRLPNGAEDGLARWGTGLVVRVDESGAAIQLDSGLFDEPDSAA